MLQGTCCAFPESDWLFYLLLLLKEQEEKRKNGQNLIYHFNWFLYRAVTNLIERNIQ